MNKKIQIALIILVAVLLSYFSFKMINQRKSPIGIHSGSEFTPVSDEELNSILGVGYLAKQEWIPELYADAGIRWVKAADIDWSQIEPKAPKNKIHNYTPELLDRYVRKYQEEGFNIQVILKSDAPWAVELGKGLSEGFSQYIKSAPPKKEFLDDYYDFVYYMVERYDGDGIDDMPGLLKPIIYFEIESEAQHPFHWNGTPEEYIEILKLAKEASLKANPDSKIILSGINFGDLYDDFPSDEIVKQRTDSLDPVMKKGFEFVKTTLAATEYYDLVEVHYNRGIFGIYGQVNEIRKYTDKPIWGGDVSTGPWMFTNFTSPFGTRNESTDYFVKIRDRIEPEYSDYEVSKSETIVKKTVLAASLGVERLIFETTNEWTAALSSEQVVDQIWYIMAMADNNGNPYPAYYTLKLLSEKIDGFKKVEKIGSEYFYKFTFENKKPIYVGWSENLNTKINLENELGLQAKITNIITEKGQMVPTTNIIKSNNITLTKTPIFIESI